MPSELQRLLNEDNPLEATVDSSRQNWVWLSSVLVGLTICVPVFFMGAQLSGRSHFWPFTAACILGGLLAGAVAVATGIVGQRTGLPTAMLAKRAFGDRGYLLANTVMVLGAVGWFGIQTAVFGEAFVKLANQVWDTNIPRVPVIVVAGLLMSTTAVVGFRGLGKLSYVAVPLLLVLLLMPLWFYGTSGELAAVNKRELDTTPMAFGTIMAMVAGAYSGATTMPDLTRFMRNIPDTCAGLFVNFGVVYPGLLILTGAVAIAANEADFMQIMLNLQFGSLAILVLFLSTWTTNDANVYSAAISANLFLPAWRRWQLTIAAGVLGTVAAVFGVFDHFTAWLIFSGNVFAPMAGVYVVDYLADKDRYHDSRCIGKEGERSAGFVAENFRIKQLLAWMIGLGVGIGTTPRENMGMDLFSITTVPMLDAVLAAGFVLMVLTRGRRP